MDDIIIKLIQNNYTVSIVTGAKDSINNYGWQVLYSVSIIHINEYCSKCRKHGELQYNDELHQGSNHKWEKEPIKVFYGVYKSMSEVEIQIIDFAKRNNIN